MRRGLYTVAAWLVLVGVLWLVWEKNVATENISTADERRWTQMGGRDSTTERESNVQHPTPNTQHPTVHSSQPTLHSSQSTLYSPQSTVYSLPPTLPIDRDPDMGTPRFVRRRSGFLSEAAPDMTPAEIAVASVDANQKVFTLHPTDIQGTNAVVTRDVLTQHNGMRSLTWQQQRDGIDIFGATFAMNLTREGEIINVQSRALHMPCVRFHDKGEKLKFGKLKAEMGEKGLRVSSFITQPSPIWYPLDQVSVVKAWDVWVEFQVSDVIPHPSLHRLIVRADTGEVVEDICLTWGLEAATFNVYTNDSPEHSGTRCAYELCAAGGFKSGCFFDGPGYDCVYAESGGVR